MGRKRGHHAMNLFAALIVIVAGWPSGLANGQALKIKDVLADDPRLVRIHRDSEP